MLLLLRWKFLLVKKYPFHFFIIVICQVLGEPGKVFPLSNFAPWDTLFHFFVDLLCTEEEVLMMLESIEVFKSNSLDAISSYQDAGGNSPQNCPCHHHTFNRYRSVANGWLPNDCKVFLFVQLLFILLSNIYAVPVWDPHLTKELNALDAVQRFSSRVCTKRWDMRGDDYLKCVTSTRSSTGLLTFQMHKKVVPITSQGIHQLTLLQPDSHHWILFLIFLACCSYLE